MAAYVLAHFRRAIQFAELASYLHKVVILPRRNTISRQRHWNYCEWGKNIKLLSD